VVIRDPKEIGRFLGTISFLVFMGTQAIPAVMAMTPDDITGMGSVHVADLSPDGKFLLYEKFTPENSDQGSTATTLRRDLASGHDLVIFSPNDDGLLSAFSPDSQSIGYFRAGGSNQEFWVMDIDGGHRRFIAVVPDNMDFFQWAPDGSAVAWIGSTKSYENRGVIDDVEVADHVGFRHLKAGSRQGELAQIFSLDLADGLVSQVTSGSYDVRSFSWAPDSQRLVYAAKALDDLGVNLNTDLWVTYVDDHDPERITNNPGGDDAPLWLVDGRIAWLRREDPIWESAPAVIAVSDAKTGDRERFETHGCGFDNYIYKFGYDDGKFYILGANHGVLDLVHVQGEQSQILTNGQHDFWNLEIAGGTAVMAGAGQMLPGALFTVDLKADHFPNQKILINPNEGWISRVGLTTPGHFVIEVEGREIEGWYFLPSHLEADDRVPVVLSIHGGPEWMYGGYFLPEFHILPTFGYAVIIANPTGSTGYGFDFQKDIRGDWVGRPARELMACLDWAVSRGWADPENMAVMGGSYGGHLAAALTTESDRFKAAAIDRAAPDLETFWGTTDEKWFPQWEFGGNPWDEEAREIYARNSPMNFVDKVRTPTLVSQGLLDYRCDAAGGLMWFSALKAQGVPTRLLRFSGEGHGLQINRNKVFYYHQLLEWFDEYILNGNDEEIRPQTHE